VRPLRSVYFRARRRIRNLILWPTPYGIVELLRARRTLRALGGRTRGRRSGLHAAATRLDLLPDGAIPLLRFVVDVGANEGRWSRALLAIACPEQLIAVEPSPVVLPALHAALDGRSGVKVVEAAVGAAAGKALLHVTEHGNNSSLARPLSEEMDALYGSGYEIAHELPVPVTTLDELTRDLPEVSLLKIDVQGFERFVLEGGPGTLAKTRWALVEATFRAHYEDDMLFPELHARMVEHGFTLIGLSRPHRLGGVAVWCDALYEHTESVGS
jgi:FkbM family methyltransferase